MENITTTEGLKYAIQLLEVEQAENEKLLKEQFYLTFESLKPVNLIRGTLKDFVSSPYLIENIIGSAIGLAGGYFTKKIVTGASTNLFRKFIGSALQVGITKAIAQNHETIKSIGHSVFRYVFHKKDEKKEIEDLS